MESTQTRQITLSPPEGVPLRFEIAPLLLRATAVVCDVVLMNISLFLLFFVIFLLLPVFGGSQQREFQGHFFAVLLVVLFLWTRFYFFLFELSWQGSTPGKRLMGIKVVSSDGRPLTLQGIIARNLMRDLEVFIPFQLAGQGFLLGQGQLWLSSIAIGWSLLVVAFPLFHPISQRLGDVIGGTFVVVVPQAELLADKARQSAVRGMSTIAFSAQHLSIYGEYELETLAGVLRKVDEGGADINDLRYLAQTIAKKIRFEGPEPLQSPLQFLQQFYAAQRQALEQKLLWGQRKANKYQSR